MSTAETQNAIPSQPAVPKGRFFANQTFHFETLRNAGYTLSSCADLGEVFETVRRITEGDMQSWYAEWSATANRVFQLAEGTQDPLSRGGAYLRASTYQRTGEFLLPPDDPKRAPSWEKTLAWFRSGLEALGVRHEYFDAPYESGRLRALYLPGPEGSEAKPLIMIVGGFDSILEELYAVLGRAALERGYSVLLHEGPGQGEALRKHGLTFTAEWEKPTAAVLDEFLRRHAKPSAIVLVGMSMGGYFAPRAAAFEPRIDAVVAFDTCYDFNETASRFLALARNPIALQNPDVSWSYRNAQWTIGTKTVDETAEALSRFTLAPVAERIRQDVLILAGTEDHFIPFHQTADFQQALRNARSVTTRVFDRPSGGAGHCQAGNYTLVHAALFDWLRAKFPVGAKAGAAPGAGAPRAAKIVGILALLLAAFGASAQAPAASPEFVIRGARVFDGSRVLSRADVWVRKGKIEAIGPHLRAPRGIATIDGAGKTLLPGLIDAHVHAMGADTNLESALALGVTTEMDMGAARAYVARMRQEQAQGKHLDLADVKSSGTQPTAPDGHGTEYGLPVPTLSSPDEAQAFVDDRVAEGADFIGEIIYDDGRELGLTIPTLSKETLAAVTQAAHRRDRIAVVHVLSEQGAKDAIASGADGLAHLFADAPPDEELVSLAVRNHTFVIPTLSLLAGMTGVPAGAALAEDPRIEPYLTSDAIVDLHQRYPGRFGNLAYAEEAVRKLHGAGVPIVAGTDAHNPGTAHGASLQGELELLVASGLAPTDALASATSVAAAAFRLHDRGVIAPGKRADLVLVEGDPTTRISEIHGVARVWKLGVELDREAYRAELQRMKEAERAARQASPPAGSESGLVSDFESGTPTSAFGLGWRAIAGRMMGGKSPEATIAVVDGGAGGSEKALRIEGEIAPGVFGWAGALFFPGPRPMAPVNLSSKRAVSFSTKGEGRTYQVMLFSKNRGSMPLTRAFVAGPEWTRVTLPLADFGTDGSDLQGLGFAALATPGRFTLLVDDVRLDE